MNKRGSVTILVGSVIPIALVSGLFAVDAARVWLARTRLQAALDAAVLAGGRDLGTTQAEKNARNIAIKAVLAGNNGRNGAPPVPGGSPSPWTNVEITEPNSSQIRVQASVKVDSILGNLLPGFGAKTITRHAVADRTATGVELALVIDVTLSMIQSAGTKTRIAAAHEAAHTLLGALYGDDSSNPAEKKKWLENVYVSVVPFNVTVNYGSANTHFLSSSSNPNYRQSWSGPTSWGGCVEMRSSAFLDASPTASGAGLRHYFWPSTYKPTEKYNPNPDNNNTTNNDNNHNRSYCRLAAAYRDTRPANSSGANHVCMGHNDWTAPEYVLTDKNRGKQNTLIAALDTNVLVRAAGLDAWTTAHGPNMMCPPDAQRVLPLTRDRTVVESRIDALRNLPFSYGTNIAAGLQAAWFTLSPHWRNENGFAGWPSAEPPADANDPRPALPSLPLDYNTERMEKVMVLLTDGDNLWLSAKDVQNVGGNSDDDDDDDGDSSNSNNVNTLVRPESGATPEGFYGSYGYLRHEFEGDITATSTSDGSSKIDDEAENWCAKIKASHGSSANDKITIYTIGFGSSIGARATATLTNCASVKDGVRLYYAAPTAEKLKEVFKNIGGQLSRLRLSQ